MLELPTDKPEIVDEGADGARRLRRRADARRRPKSTRSAASSSRSGAAASAPGRASATSSSRCCSIESRYAERLPIGKPEILRTAPAARLRAFYDTWYRPDRMAIVAVGDIDAAADRAGDPDGVRSADRARAGRAAARSDGAAARGAARQRRDRSRAHALDRAARPQAAGASGSSASATTAAIWSSGSSTTCSTSDSASWRASPTRSFSAPAPAADSLSRRVDTFTLSARVQDGSIDDGLRRSPSRPGASASSASAASELDRAKRWMAAFYERAYNERDKTESGSYAQEYSQLLPRGRAAPGIEYEYRLVQQRAARHHARRRSRRWRARACSATTAASSSPTSPQKPSVPVPSEAELQAALAVGRKRRGHALDRHDRRRGR